MYLKFEWVLQLIVAILKVVMIFHPFNDTVFIVSKTMYGFKTFGKKINA